MCQYHAVVPMIKRHPAPHIAMNGQLVRSNGDSPFSNGWKYSRYANGTTLTTPRMIAFARFIGCALDRMA
jgi:hypothetical protein